MAFVKCREHGIYDCSEGWWNIAIDGSFVTRRTSEIEANREAVNIINGKIKRLETDRKILTDEILDAT